MKVSGLDEAINSINGEIGKIEGLAQAGLWEAGLKILRQAQIRLKDSVITGNLRASGYARAENNFDRPMAEVDASKNESVPSDRLPPIGVEIGFTANYALYVHENMGGRSPKFLEGVIMDNRAEIVEIVRSRSGGE